MKSGKLYRVFFCNVILLTMNISVSIRSREMKFGTHLAKLFKFYLLSVENKLSTHFRFNFLFCWFVGKKTVSVFQCWNNVFHTLHSWQKSFINIAVMLKQSLLEQEKFKAEYKTLPKNYVWRIFKKFKTYGTVNNLPNQWLDWNCE